MNMTTIVILRLLHVVVGIFWAGTVFFVARFLLPSIRAAGPAGGAVMQQLTQVRRFPAHLLGAAIVTILSGLALYWHDSEGFHNEWMRSGSGRVFAMGAACAVIAATIGASVNSPAAKRLGELGEAIGRSGTGPTPDQAAEMARLQKRLVGATQVVALLVLLATVAMATARYIS